MKIFRNVIIVCLIYLCCAENFLFFEADNFESDQDEDNLQISAIEPDQATVLKHSLLSITKGVNCNSKQNRKHCWVSCEQHKLAFSDHCCQCTCRRGYVLDEDKKSCNLVTWGAWSSWTKCLATEWGGLQTRRRKCLTKKHVSANGRCLGEGTRSRTCSSVTSDYFIRKNVRHLSDEEVQDLVQAMTKFKNDLSVSGHDNLVGWHGWPFRCHWNKQYKGHKNGHCSFHMDVRFPAWHRLIVVQLERGLSKYMRNKTLGIPYWDWTESIWKGLPPLLGNKTIFDTQRNITVENPFYRSLVRGHKPLKLFNGEPFYSQRRVGYDGLRQHAYFLRGVIRALTSDSFRFFDRNFEITPHNVVHGCLCNGTDRCSYGMTTVDFAAWDPAFMIHHSQVDRIYTLHRVLREELQIQDWTKEYIFDSYKPKIKAAKTRKKMMKKAEDLLHAIEMPLSPFCNASMNPFQVTLRKGVSNVITSYYGQELFGYKYDSFNLDDRDWRLLLVDMIKYRNRLNSEVPGLPFVSEMGKDLGLISKNSSSDWDLCKEHSHKHKS